jgi:ASC-1-like (ASCH) protein/ribosomal protein S18 acetylase RimI-like enzyme
MRDSSTAAAPKKVPEVIIREAIQSDWQYVVSLIGRGLAPFYDGDHHAHANRIFSTHIAGTQDLLGHFSFEQRMFVIVIDGSPAGILHLVGKRQGTFKISPILIDERFRTLGLGDRLLLEAESYALKCNARQIYCTVAEQNKQAVQFFLRHGYITAGRSASHYKRNITELMLYKPLNLPDLGRMFDEHNISVTPFEPHFADEVRELLLKILPQDFNGIDDSWVDALFEGYDRRSSEDVNQKYKLIFVASDREDRVVGVAGATPKKGKPIKLMPFIATNLPAFAALLTDLPFQLRPYGHKLYMHIVPTVDETIALQRHGWKLDAALPGAYHDSQVTQQWSFDLTGEGVMRMMRVKQYYLSLIESGKKTLEVRVGYGNINTIQPGERIRLTSGSNTAFIMVTAIRRYNSFALMLEMEPADCIAPGKDKDQVLQLLRSIYPPPKERLGVVVLEIKFIRMENRTRHESTRQ